VTVHVASVTQAITVVNMDVWNTKIINTSSIQILTGLKLFCKCLYSVHMCGISK